MRPMLAAVVLCALALTMTGAAPARTVPNCDRACVERVQKRELRQAKERKARRLRREWRYWTRQYIPTCTWWGESGPGPQFARWRYSVMNTQGSGARGKYQMMPGTYAAFAKYGDWSPLDQEIAAHRLYRAQGTSPWAAC